MAVDDVLAAVFFTLFGTWLWIIKRTIAIQVITRISCGSSPPHFPVASFPDARLLVGLLVTPIAIAQRLSLYFTTLLRVVTTPFLNAARRSPTPPRAPTGGLSRPVSSAPRFQVQWARQRGGPAMRGSARRMGNIPISLASTV
jgi:hypothetical protein